jgi:hypothetical protein
MKAALPSCATNTKDGEGTKYMHTLLAMQTDQILANDSDEWSPC